MTDREQAVSTLDEIAVGTMREVQVDGTAVLLVRLEDGVRALGARCPHFGAPLADGLLSDGRIVCPWHHACFSAKTGDLLEPPSHDGLTSYPVRVVDGQILVTVPASPGDARAPRLARPDPAHDPRVFAIIGAGAAGATAAWTLRAEGFQGRIVMITREDRLPYDRTFLSKELLMGIDLPAPEDLRPDTFWRDAGIEVWQGREVARLDVKAREIEFADGERLTYDRALLASGARPRTLDVPGANLRGVQTLRVRADLEPLLQAALAQERVVVVGASFIALEVAASLAGRGIEVTVIAPEELPFAPVFGERVGRALLKVHEEMATKLLLGRQVTGFEGRDHVEAVVSDRGERIPADLVLVGIGVTPATDMIDGVALDDDGGVPVDAFMCATDDLYAAGDVARFPEPVSGECVRIEHWRLACQHGALAARNMLGRALPFMSVPFFWSAQKLALYYVGHAPGFDDVVFDGAPDEGPFLAWYLKQGRVVAALGVERNRDMCAIHELMRRKALPAAVDVKRGVDPQARLSEVQSNPSG